jgi:threonine dehydratase
MVFVHPFGDPYVVAGQGTIGLEILEDLPNVRSVIVPVGGGGLVNGIATALRAKEREVESGGGERNHNKLKIFGVQAEGAAPLLKSFESGRAERIGDPHTIADGIAATYVFDYMFPLFKENEIQPLVVSDREIEQAMRHIMKECHAIAEPAGASSLAAAWRYRSQLEEPIVCVVSGGNADFSLLSRLISD